MYARNLYAGHTLFVGDGAGGSGTINVHTIRASDIVASNNITSPTFNGDLQGVAAGAVSANVAVSITSSPGHSVNSGTSNPLSDDTTATALPSSDFALIYLASEYGIQDVKVDPENELKKLINQTTLSGGVSDRPLTVGEIRSKLRDDNNRDNDDFTAKCVAEKKLNPESLGKKPPSKVGRTASDEATVTEGYAVIGPTGPGGNIQ